MSALENDVLYFVATAVTAHNRLSSLFSHHSSTEVFFPVCGTGVLCKSQIIYFLPTTSTLYLLTNVIVSYFEDHQKLAGRSDRGKTDRGKRNYRARGSRGDTPDSETEVKYPGRSRSRSPRRSSRSTSLESDHRGGARRSSDDRARDDDRDRHPRNRDSDL